MQTIEQTMDVYELVSTAFEPCTAFAPAHGGSPVCAACGWLDADHEAAGAEVHAFPRRAAAPPLPKRLAS